MKVSALVLLTGITLTACNRTLPNPIVIAKPRELSSLVGRRVEVVGTVSSGGVPQVHGIDLWGMEHLRGKCVSASGILRRTVFTREGSDYGRAQDSGNGGFIAPVYRGPGTFYRLENSRYVQSPANQTVQRTGASRFADVTNRASLAAGSRR